MPLIKPHSYGDWRNEDDVRARFNRNLISGGTFNKINLEIYVPDEKTDEGTDPVGYTIYTFNSNNSYDIESIYRVRPAFAEGEEEERGYIDELFITESMYSYFVYLVPGEIIAWKQVPFTEWYKTEDQ